MELSSAYRYYMVYNSKRRELIMTSYSAETFILGYDAVIAHGSILEHHPTILSQATSSLGGRNVIAIKSYLVEGQLYELATNDSPTGHVYQIIDINPDREFPVVAKKLSSTGELSYNELCFDGFGIRDRQDGSIHRLLSPKESLSRGIKKSNPWQPIDQESISSLPDSILIARSDAIDATFLHVRRRRTTGTTEYYAALSSNTPTNLAAFDLWAPCPFPERM